jgi:Flp pilus assembly protein TadB
MVVKEPVELAADAVIDHARAEADARKNASARRLPLLYRFDELRGLEPWQQARIVQQGGALANRDISVVASCFVGLTLIVVAAFVSPPWFHDSGLAVSALLLVLPFILIRRARVRHHVRQLLRSEKQGEQS